MKLAVNVFILAGLITGLSFAQGVHLSAKYSYPTLPGTKQDSVLHGLGSIRGCWFDTDIDGDGKSEIVVTNYNDLGHVHVFETVGNDSIKLVWTSPTVAAGGGASTPRYVLVGDLDNDGKKEIIYQSNGNGIYIFEWDGVVGSDNYGTSPSQVIGTPFLTGTTGNIEYMEIEDVDGDGQNELLVAYNGATADDRYYIISAVGDWSTNDPGFSSFTVEYNEGRTTMSTKYGLTGGSPIAMIAANFDGAGNKEILLHGWNYKDIAPMRVLGTDSYALSDTTNGKQDYYLGGQGVYDDVALFGGFAYDIDKDGRDEVYLPTYPASGSSNASVVHMISYDPGKSVSEIDSSDVTKLDLSPALGGLKTSIFGYGYGDIDGNGKPNLYFSTVYPYNVISMEFQGGDKKDPANWIGSILYPGDSTIYTAITYKDSAGVKDTIKTIDASFVSKMYSHATDFDKDGYQDIILPYQALSDSIAVTHLTWNVSQYDTVKTMVLNPKRWGLRILEGSVISGVQAKDLTIIMPDDYKLGQNYPNPFNPSTMIPFSLPVKGRISLKVYDILGKEVRTLIDNKEFPAGSSKVEWDGKARNGSTVSSGTYFYSLIYGNFRKTNKMVILK